MTQTTIYDYLQPNFVQEIYNFNKQAGLLDKGYSDFLESSFQIEEALEGFNIEEVSQNTTDYQFKTSSAKELARYILDHEQFVGSDVDRLDKAIDAIVFAIGSIAKLGLNIEQIHRAIGVVTEANLQKLSNIKVDANGKLLKDSNFVGPEKALQRILDERK